MSEKDQEFYEVVDRFIGHANELVPDYGTSRISAALLFAASRFNAHNFYAADGDPANTDTMVEYYCGQYRDMLMDNLERLGSRKEG